MIIQQINNNNKKWVIKQNQIQLLLTDVQTPKTKSRNPPVLVKANVRERVGDLKHWGEDEREKSSCKNGEDLKRKGCRNGEWGTVNGVYDDLPERSMLLFTNLNLLILFFPQLYASMYICEYFKMRKRV